MIPNPIRVPGPRPPHPRSQPMPQPVPRVRGPRSRLLRILTAPVCAAALLAGGLPAAVAAQAAAKPVLPSKDPFYVYTGSVPLKNISPGTVLKKRAVKLDISSLTVPYQAEQVLYRTKGQQGQPMVSATTIIKPLDSKLAKPKIVSYQTAYDALGSQCDPSYTLRGGDPGNSTAQEEAAIIGLYVTAGYTATVPDYEGSRTLAWAAGQTSGWNTLDGIRATERFLKVSSSTPAGMLGYSGGSIATEWASELAPHYAKGLNLVGAAAGGVP